MDEKVFTQFLNKYRVVRSRDAFVPARSRRESSRGSNSSSTSSRGGELHDRMTAAPPRAAAAAGPAVREFWSGLQSYLESRYSPAEAKAIAAAFDELHYNSLKELNFEDLDDVAGMIAKELDVSLN